jgi:hypothetical protein
METFDLQQPIEWISARERLCPSVKPETPIDKAVSDIVGKPIKVNNPDLIRLVAKWRKAKGDSDEPDNFLQDEEKIRELKQTL